MAPFSCSGGPSQAVDVLGLVARQAHLTQKNNTKQINVFTKKTSCVLSWTFSRASFWRQATALQTARNMDGIRRFREIPGLQQRTSPRIRTLFTSFAKKGSRLYPIATAVLLLLWMCLLLRAVLQQCLSYLLRVLSTRASLPNTALLTVTNYHPPS